MCGRVWWFFRAFRWWQAGEMDQRVSLLNVGLLSCRNYQRQCFQPGETLVLLSKLAWFHNFCVVLLQTLTLDVGWTQVKLMLAVHLSMSVFLSVILSVCLSIRPSVFLPIYIYVYHLSICLFYLWVRAIILFYKWNWTSFHFPSLFFCWHFTIRVPLLTLH